MSNEKLYYDALKHIAKDYATVNQIYRYATQDGLSEQEALEMSYENIKATAARAIHGKRKPKTITKPTSNSPTTSDALTPKPSSPPTSPLAGD